MNKITFQIGLVAMTCLLVLTFPLYSFFYIYPHFTDIITFEKEVNAKQIARHITKMLVVDSTNKTLAPESISEEFVSILKEAKSDFDLTKVKIFSHQGKVLYSSEPQDIGSINDKSYFTDTVAKGKIFSMIVHKEDKTMEGEITHKDVVETYVPLMRGQLFVGALEVYYDITYAEHSISKFVNKSKVIVTVLTLLLLLCIVLLTYTGTLYCRNLRDTEKKMQLMKEKIPPIYKDTLDKLDS